jgi:hypothetical protein
LGELKSHTQGAAAVTDDWVAKLRTEHPLDEAARARQQAWLAGLLARRAAEAERQAELLAEHELALRLIEIGYKMLAKELHPDKGRDAAMARLNRVRKRLQQRSA